MTALDGRKAVLDGREAVLDGRIQLLASKDIPCFGTAQPRKTPKKMKQVQTMKINKFSC